MGDEEEEMRAAMPLLHARSAVQASQLTSCGEPINEVYHHAWYRADPARWEVHGKHVVFLKQLMSGLLLISASIGQQFSGLQPASDGSTLVEVPFYHAINDNVNGDGRASMGERLSGRARSCRAMEGQRPRMQAPLEMEDLLHSFVSSASSLPAKVWIQWAWLLPSSVLLVFRSLSFQYGETTARDGLKNLLFESGNVNVVLGCLLKYPLLATLQYQWIPTNLAGSGAGHANGRS
ncbi:hypothetical protein ACQ4PT_052499 [Festuca glaucescens]